MTFAKAANVIFDKAVVIGALRPVLQTPALYAGIPTHKGPY
jgi:hypothetical protein